MVRSHTPPHLCGTCGGDGAALSQRDSSNPTPPKSGHPKGKVRCAVVLRPLAYLTTIRPHVIVLRSNDAMSAGTRVVINVYVGPRGFTATVTVVFSKR